MTKTTQHPTPDEQRALDELCVLTPELRQVAHRAWDAAAREGNSQNAARLALEAQALWTEAIRTMEDAEKIDQVEALAGIRHMAAGVEFQTSVADLAQDDESVVRDAAERVAAANAEMRQAVAHAHGRGVSVTALSAAAGVTRQTIYRWLE